MRIALAVNTVVHDCASRSVRAMSIVCLALNSETGEIHLLNCGHPQDGSLAGLTPKSGVPHQKCKNGSSTRCRLTPGVS